jgi:hypothetical protein
MVLNKIVTYLYNVGCVVLGIGIVGKMLIRLPFLDFIHKNVFIYMTAVGIFMMVPSWIYKLYHFNTFRSENKQRLLTFALVTVGVLIMIYIVRGV